MADVTIGAKLTLDGGDAEKSVKSIKAQLKEANLELIKAQESFGDYSKEAINAAKKVAELRDKVQEANETAQLFDPGKKFAAFGGALNAVTNGFTALTGAMGLLGVESEDVQKQLLKVQSAMALSQGLSAVADSVKDFKRLGAIIQSTTIFQKANNAATIAATTIQKAFGVSVVGTGRAFTILKGAIAATGIGLLVIGIGMLVEKIMEWTSSTDDLTDSQDRLNNSLERHKELMDEELNRIDFVTKLRLANAKKNGATEKELTQITVDGVKQRITEYEKERDRLTAIRKDGTEWAKLDFKQREQLLKDEVAANKAVLEEKKRLQLTEAEAAAAAAEKSRGGRTTSARKDKGLSAADQFALDSKKKLAEEQFFLEQEEFRKSLEAKKLNADAVTQIDNDRFMKSSALQEATTLAEKSNVEARIRLAELERDAKIQAAQSIGGALGALSDLVGKQTAVGKVLGIAQATINTFIGATEVLRAKSVLPEPFGTISKIANVTAIIATGLAAVKNIVKTQVPGYSAGGGGTTAATSAPVTPQLPNATRTTLDQQQLNQIGNATVRAFVVESDVTNNQERIRRLNRAARL